MSVDKLVDSTQLDSDLTSVANAIRTKGGTSAQLAFPAGFVSAIAAIPSGGGVVEADWNDVCFWDYDGTCLYSYSAADFANLSALPENPSHTGLTAQGWNWTLADAKTFVAANGFLDIGQLYVTTDDKSHIHVVLQKAESVSLVLTGSATGNLTIDWGDSSSTETNANTSATTYSHTYSQGGKYDITVARSTGTVTFRDRLSASDLSVVREINLGSNVVLHEACFQRLMALSCVSMPSDCNVSNYGGPTGIKCMIFPSTALANNTGLNESLTEIICFAKQSETNNYFGKFKTNYSLKRLSAPVGKSGGGWGNQILISCRSLQRFIVADGVTSFTANTGNDLWALQKLTIPASVATVNGFTNTYSLQEVHMKASSPPTLSSSSNFTNHPANFVIYVPYSADHSILNAYKTASNWSTFASYIYEEASS